MWEDDSVLLVKAVLDRVAVVEALEILNGAVGEEPALPK